MKNKRLFFFTLSEETPLFLENTAFYIVVFLPTISPPPKLTLRSGTRTKPGLTLHFNVEITLFVAEHLDLPKLVSEIALFLKICEGKHTVRVFHIEIQNYRFHLLPF